MIIDKEFKVEDVTNAFSICKKVLLSQNIISETETDDVSAAAEILSKKMVKAICGIIDDFTIVSTEELVLSTGVDDAPSENEPVISQTSDYQASVDSVISSPESSALVENDEEYQPKQKKAKTNYVPLETKN